MTLFAITLFKFLLNLIYVFVRLFPTENKISLLSRESDHPSIDFIMIAEELIKREVKVCVLTKKMKNGVPGRVGYFFHIIRQMHAIATSKVVVVDTYCIPVSVLRHKKSLKVIQIWHSSAALKKFGYQTIGKQGGSSALVAKSMNMHKNYDYAAAPSRITAECFSEAFNLPLSSVVKLGLPRLEYIAKEIPKKSKEILSKYGLEHEERKMLLYAPTYRRYRPAEPDDLIQHIDKSRYFVIVSLHPLENLEPPEERSKDCLILKDGSSYDLLSIADAVISDYSAILVEASVLNLPLYIYAYDYDEYAELTGLNVKWEGESLSEYFFTDASALSEKLSLDYDYGKLTDFRDKYLETDYEKCTEETAEFLYSFLNAGNKGKGSKTFGVEDDE